MRTVPVRLLVIPLALIALGLVACGDDGSDAGTGGGDVDISIDGDVDVDAAVGDEACQQGVETLGEASRSVVEAFTGGIDDVDALIDKLSAFVDAAPEEIRADARVLLEGYRGFLERYGESGIDFLSGEGPDDEAIAALEAASDKLSEPEFEAASRRIADWIDEHCG